MISGLLVQETGDITWTGSETKERLQQQIGAHGAMGGFHFRHARLARADTFSRLGLRQTKSLSSAAEAVGQSQFDFDKSVLVGRELEKIACIPDSPPGTFELSAFIVAHGDSLSCPAQPSETRPVVPDSRR